MVRVRIPFYQKNKKEKTLGKTEGLWQREKDSNPHIRSQSPLCYHYTIPLCSLTNKIYYTYLTAFVNT